MGEYTERSFWSTLCDAQPSEEQVFLFAPGEHKRLGFLHKGCGPLLDVNQNSHLERQPGLAQMDLPEHFRSPRLRRELGEYLLRLLACSTREQETHLQQQRGSQDVNPVRLTLGERLSQMLLRLVKFIPLVGKRRQ